MLALMKIDHQYFQGKSQKLSLLEPIKLGRVRSVRLTWSFPLSPPTPPPRSVWLTWLFFISPHVPSLPGEIALPEAGRRVCSGGLQRGQPARWTRHHPPRRLPRLTRAGLEAIEEEEGF